ncbi:MAG: S-layer homology domain-containing protein [Clostridia bacterium]|nr:S-layer homology domain-containing protein [Clostridia bacterium]
MRKFFAVFLCLCMLSSVCIVPVSAQEDMAGIFTLLNTLNIMTGDPDGNLRLDDTVTRAEFTKAAVAASSFKNSVATHLSVSPFGDVTYRHWAAPYVRVGVSNGLVSGYPDATFRPDEPVLFEEGITILLRVLGYNDSDFGASWPYGQIGLANNLEITDGVSCTAGTALNRRQVAQLIYQALGTKTKGQNAQLASVFDVTISRDVTLISDSKDDPSIPSDEVYTSQGSLKTTASFDRNLLGLRGDAAIKNGNKLLAFVPDAESADSEQYILYSVLPNAVMVYKNGALTALSVADSTTVYKGKSQSNFAAVKSSLELGDVLRVKRSGNNIDYITCQAGNMQGPTIVSASEWDSSWATNSSTKVLRNGQSSSLSALEPYDVAYFMPDMNLVLSYSDKVTGVYENASPNKDMPQSVTVSGKEYTIESGNAFTALTSGGAFDFGDSVTLLLGKTGQIAGVISPNATATKSLTGYVLSTGRKEYQSGAVNTYTGYYIKLAFPDGTTSEYTTDKNLSSYQNKVVKVTFQNGNAKVTLVTNNDSKKLSGTYNHSTGKLGSYTLAPDAQILDIGTVNASSPSVYCKIFPQRLDGVTLSTNQVLYWEKNSQGAINKLILKDVTGDEFSYGLMTAVSQNRQELTGSYTYIIDGQFYQLNTSNRVLNVAAGSGIRISGSPSNPESFQSLTELGSGIRLESASALTYKNKTYPISPNVAVYQRSNAYAAEYVKIPIADVLSDDSLQISAYYDQSPSAGGQIRVIVVY